MTATSSRRRRLRALPRSWDSDTESDTDPRPSCEGASSNVPPELLDAMERYLTMDPHESVTQAPSGLLPTWVDEASNPGPGDIRNARRCGALSWIAKVLRRRPSRCTGLDRVRNMRAEWLCHRGNSSCHHQSPPHVTSQHSVTSFPLLHRPPGGFRRGSWSRGLRSSSTVRVA